MPPIPFFFGVNFVYMNPSIELVAGAKVENIPITTRVVHITNQPFFQEENIPKKIKYKPEKNASYRLRQRTCSDKWII